VSVVRQSVGGLGRAAQVAALVSCRGPRTQSYRPVLGPVERTVPVGANFAGIKALLAQEQDEGWWRYAVGWGTDEWRNA
jgi:hypothetical protein